MTRLSCHRFCPNEVRLWLSVPAYNLGNLWRRLALPKALGNWSLTSLQQRLVKTGGRLVKHARYYWLLLAESHLTRRLFAGMLRKIAALPMRDSPGRWKHEKSSGAEMANAAVSVEIGRGWPGSGSQPGEAMALSALSADPSACGGTRLANWRYALICAMRLAAVRVSKRKFRINPQEGLLTGGIAAQYWLNERA